MKEEFVRALFLLAGIEIIRLNEILNQYWPDNEYYAKVRRDNPWWLVETRNGIIKIGWRKRVISIDWENTPLRTIITRDDVTKNETSVHAWGYSKAVEYLHNLGIKLIEPITTQ